MPMIDLHNHDCGAEPAVSFATCAEIALADQLRHQLEERNVARRSLDTPPPDYLK